MPSPALAELSDDDLIDRAKRARNGDRFTRLWAGNLSDYGGDHSRADAALCCMLAFWSNGDSDRIDRLFRRSGLMRDKWDRRSGETTYGALTIRVALNEG
jgi:primase-polymerase (primpol)-like protein